MYRIATLILFLVSFSTSISFGQIEQRELYQRKVESYTKMKRTGFTIAGIGTVVTAYGVIQLSRATWETTGTQTTSNDPEALQGSVGLLVGIPAVITGTVLGIVGSAKSKSYNKKLQRLNVGINYTSQNTGLVLTYRF